MVFLWLKRDVPLYRPNLRSTKHGSSHTVKRFRIETQL